MQAFGTELSKEEIEALYRKADVDGSNDVNEEELADCLAAAHKAGDISKVPSSDSQTLGPLQPAA